MSVGLIEPIDSPEEAEAIYGPGGTYDPAAPTDTDTTATTDEPDVPDTSGDGTPTVDSPEEARERYGPDADQAETGGLVDTSGGSSGDPTDTTDPSIPAYPDGNPPEPETSTLGGAGELVPSTDSTAVWIAAGSLLAVALWRGS